MNCLCPVCNQEAEFPPEAVGKWTRCAEGCRAIGTRFRVVAGGVGELEAPANPASASGPAPSGPPAWAPALCLVALSAPFFAALPRPLALALAGLGAAGLAACYDAWKRSLSPSS